MSSLVERLRGRKWRMTPQRRVIAETLDCGEHVHYTAEDILNRASVHMPEISRATVYNTLNDLVSLGEVLEVSVDGRSKRYDPNIHHDHEHLVCDACGAVRDVHIDGDALSLLSPQESHGFLVTEAKVTYRGICPDCQGRS
ncbi:Fur family transcriptional regulator [Haloglycomyces albus]|uniref:Fur family transcriptional regulator n=1 Tax=Haloglycomyces albus TaxID=526067 RepID=UPI00046CBA79|nr:Fur family transcriptional regulator [Haloglycomyces albus]